MYIMIIFIIGLWPIHTDIMIVYRIGEFLIPHKFVLFSVYTEPAG